MDKRTFETTINNYDSINKAVDLELARANALVERSALVNQERRTRIALYIVGSLCIIGISCAIIYAILTTERKVTIDKQIIETKSDQATLEELKASNQPTKEQEPFTHQTFTVFLRTTSADGQSVITGRTYHQDNLKEPEKQYCYIEILDRAVDGSDYKVKNIAHYEFGSIKYLVDDPKGKALADNYCQFLKQ